MRPDWNTYFMDQAYRAADRSDDPITKLGCVFVDSHTMTPISTGYNGTIRGQKLSPEEYQRPNKYKRMFHAEENCIFNSRENPLFYPWPVLAFITGVPCVGLFGNHPGCTEKLIQIGIRDFFIGNQKWSGSDNKEYNDYFDELVKEFDVNVIYVR